MDRYEVPIDDHLAPLVEAVERGDEVVIMREGEEVVLLAPLQPILIKPASPMSMRESLERLHDATKHLPKLAPGEAARLVREMRDEGY